MVGQFFATKTLWHFACFVQVCARSKASAALPCTNHPTNWYTQAPQKRWVGSVNGRFATLRSTNIAIENPHFSHQHGGLFHGYLGLLECLQYPLVQRVLSVTIAHHVTSCGRVITKQNWFHSQHGRSDSKVDPFGQIPWTTLGTRQLGQH